MGYQNIFRLINEGLRLDNSIVRPIAAKTAAYSVTEDDFGTLFTNRGAAGSVTITLPAAASYTGKSVEFYCIASQNIALTAAAGTIVTKNNAAATTATLSTGGDQEGGSMIATSDGTSWLINSGDTTVTAS
jgi:hypothetical protein|tara:strand:+ start:599 stop:991 length:393 start_codon:yes stop_codon:yes gene_type:complete